MMLEASFMGSLPVLAQMRATLQCTSVFPRACYGHFFMPGVCPK